MGGYYGVAVLLGVALLLMSGLCDVNCGGRDGHAGLAGAPGRSGWPGAKGEKGEAAVMANNMVDTAVLQKLKGEMGNRGLQGVMGPKGFSGYLGPAGPPGKPGPPGRNGGSFSQEQHSGHQARSAFSAFRTDTSYPTYDETITYQNTVVNTSSDFNAATGQFVCKEPGVYYFTFTCVAKVSICLYIASDALTDKLGFCDYNVNTDQVLSGSVVLHLAAKEKVWLESFRDQQKATDAQDTKAKQIIFSGFLLFANPK
ncbi:complement C1q subcomponent subunit A-like [Pempheris klunzingeri]|uniref:complement C1q subcomponent subunit A-like n=1 Tax=Pempheris klunzingeri TaxID=3127111 RepID=UPI0039808DAE